jgi:hypothetical protein
MDRDYARAEALVAELYKRGYLAVPSPPPFEEKHCRYWIVESKFGKVRISWRGRLCCQEGKVWADGEQWKTPNPSLLDSFFPAKKGRLKYISGKFKLLKC